MVFHNTLILIEISSLWGTRDTLRFVKDSHLRESWVNIEETHK